MSASRQRYSGCYYMHNHARRRSPSSVMPPSHHMTEPTVDNLKRFQKMSTASNIVTHKGGWAKRQAYQGDIQGV